MTVFNCPRQDLLASFCDGLADDEDTSRIAEHVETCTQCQAVMETLVDRPHDTLVNKLRRIPGNFDPFAAEPMCIEIVGKVARLTSVGFDDQDHTPGSGLTEEIPEFIGNYKVLKLLGRGGMGTVYQALHVGLDKVVAIKLLPERLAQNAAAVARFQREIKAVGKFQHPNIVAAHDAGEANGTHFLVMEFVSGVDLAELTRPKVILAVADACELIRQAACGLEHAARRGLVHRDIKPSNLMLTRDDEVKPLVKILDFGLALLGDSLRSAAPNSQHSELTWSGQVMGTVDYMAPEQALDSHDVDVRVDVYALGATLYKLLTGETPFSKFQDESIARKLAALAYESAPSITLRRPDLPTELARLIDSMLARSRDERPATPGEVVKRLAPFVGGSRIEELLAPLNSSKVDKDAHSQDTTSHFGPAGSVPETLSQFAPVVNCVSDFDHSLDSALGSKLSLQDSFCSRIIRRILPIVVACGFLIAGWSLLQIYYFQTRDGIVVLEIKDPGVKVTLGEKSFTLENSNQKYEISPGAHTLRIEHGGLTYESDKFTLLSGKTEIFKVQLRPDKVLVVQGDKEIAAKQLEGVSRAPALAVPPVVKVKSRATAKVAATQFSSLNPREIPTSLDWEWTVPERLGPAINTDGDESGPHLSADGLRLWFQRDVFSVTDRAWVSVRESLDKPWMPAKSMGRPFELTGAMGDLFISRDELNWIFVTWDDQVTPRIMESTRTSRDAAWSLPKAVTEAGLPSQFPVLTDDGLTLYLMKNFLSIEGDEICVMTRPSKTAAWSAPVRLEAPVNTIADERPVWVSSDNLVLIFHAALGNRTSSRQFDLWLTSRPTTQDSWQEPVSFGPVINSPELEAGACLSPNGRELIFESHRPGSLGKADLYVSRRVPKKTRSTIPEKAIAPFDSKQAKTHQIAWAKHLGVPVEYTNSIGMKFMLIPPGEFAMGSTAVEIEAALKDFNQNRNYWQPYIKSETPQHQVILTEPIYLGVNEVTQAEYEKVVGTNPSHFARLGQGKDVVAGMATTDHPVEMVSWNEAAEFCDKLSRQEKLEANYFREGEAISPLNGTGYRLPSEAEWEFACRAGTVTKYWVGDQVEDLLRASSFGGNSGDRTHTVRELKANPFGLYDIHGNVWELVQDGWNATYYDQFQEILAVNPNSPVPADSQRVIRGGSWSTIAPFCRSSNRLANVPTLRFDDVGFRVALTVAAVKGTIAERRPESNNVKVGWNGWPADMPPPAVAPFDARQARKTQDEWARHLGVPVEYMNTLGMKFMLIPPGEFTMGSTPAEIDAAPKLPGEDDYWRTCARKEGPQHKVIVTKPFYFAIHEVTQAEYAQLIGHNPSSVSPTGSFKDRVAGLDTSKFPVETISWNDACKFCDSLSTKEGRTPFTLKIGAGAAPEFQGNGYRLPTEAEWEFACRAGTTTQFWCGDSFEENNAVAWHGANCQHRTHEVGSLKANPFGLYDVHGNVWEWALDSWDPASSETFSELQAIDPLSIGTDTSRRAVRGGFWASPEARCSSARRFAQLPHEKYSHNGFRIALPVEAVK